MATVRTHGDPQYGVDSCFTVKLCSKNVAPNVLWLSEEVWPPGRSFVIHLSVNMLSLHVQTISSNEPEWHFFSQIPLRLLPTTTQNQPKRLSVSSWSSEVTGFTPPTSSVKAEKKRET